METKRITFVSEEGYKYVLKFIDESNTSSYSILSISIDLHTHKNTSLSLKDLFAIGRIFRDFLSKNQNGVLTYVCDDRSLYTSKRNRKLSPQEYRNKLFAAIFKKLNDGTYFKRDLTLGEGEDKQYLSFIGLSKNAAIINECATVAIEKLEG